MSAVELPNLGASPSSQDVFDNGIAVFREKWNPGSRNRYFGANTNNVRLAAYLKTTQYGSAYHLVYKQMNGNSYVRYEGIGGVSTVFTENMYSYEDTTISASLIVEEVYLTVYPDLQSALDAIDNYTPTVMYPITYSYSNSTVTGVSEAAVGETVVVSAVPDNNYGITDPTSQISVTNNDVAVPFQWNPSTNTITFTMPDPT